MVLFCFKLPLGFKFAGTSGQIRNIQHSLVHNVCSVTVSTKAFSIVKQDALFQHVIHTQP